MDRRVLKMADRIVISDLHARCIIGINAEERREKQDVLITVVIVTDFCNAVRSDCTIEEGVDYRALKKAILAMAEDSRYRLLEALAESIARTCFDHAAVSEVRVKVDKPSAPRFARSVSVDIIRGREG